MEKTSAGMDPPPPIDLSISSSYRVFISHRGPDVKTSLASALYNDLELIGLRAFLVSEELKVGDILTDEIRSAIETCPIRIVIFSPNYAASPWCLAELDLILKTGAKFVPVFYEVHPDDLADVDNGLYAHAFKEYVEKGRHQDQLDEWKEVLKRASVIAGIQCETDDDMGQLCKTIVDTVLTELKNAKQSFKLEVAEYHLVGLDDALQDLEATITKSKSEDKMIAIVGEAGVGKTTLAKEFYNRNRSSYKRSSFLSNVREAHANKSMAKLKDQIISDLCLPLSTATLPRADGADMLKAQLQNWHSQALVILDDIDSLEQLEALAVKELLTRGALVIITTRHRDALASFGMRPTPTYCEMKGLDAEPAKELLCWHAFRSPDPPAGCEKMVHDFVGISGGLPSRIVSMGLHLSNITKPS